MASKTSLYFQEATIYIAPVHSVHHYHTCHNTGIPSLIVNPWNFLEHLHWAPDLKHGSLAAQLLDILGLYYPISGSLFNGLTTINSVISIDPESWDNLKPLIM